MKPWSTEDAKELYGITRWSDGYFSVNNDGNVCVNPKRDRKRFVDIYKLVESIEQKHQIYPPILLRFPNVLEDRIARIHTAFRDAIDLRNYEGNYNCVFPIKVNQQRQVVNDVLSFGKRWHMGLEVGSKPELLIAMAIVDDPDTPIICNGFKDEEYVEAVVLTAKMGRRIILVVEQFRELRLLAKQAAKHNTKPSIGIRVKLSTRGAGKWEDSGGEKSKFGLYVREVSEAIEYLERNELLDCLQLLHFHLGSQISDISSLNRGLTELSRVYVGLREMGATNVSVLDIGGGLGVDYDGSNSSNPSSMNYSIRDYAKRVVTAIADICDASNQPHPSLYSESGRALTAYQSVLVFNVLGSSGSARHRIPEKLPANASTPLVTLMHLYKTLGSQSLLQTYHQARSARLSTLELFNLGKSTINDRAVAGRLFFAICAGIRTKMYQEHVQHTELVELEELLATTYFCNLSIFQSLPDSWAIDQIFPIMPIHRLDERPTQHGVLADITCDSDGKINKFVQNGTCTNTLRLHPFDPENSYYLGAFLVGAYQEILGDMHNLFGDTHVAHITFDSQGQPVIDEIVESDTVREMMEYVQYTADDMQQAVEARIKQARDNEKLSEQEATDLLEFYREGLEGYTYLE
jgi:arginine decarboxylase